MAQHIVAEGTSGGSGFDFRRNLAFATFSGAYLGCAQHYIYNMLFTRWVDVPFAAASAGKRAALKVLLDGIWHVPLVYLPLYYGFENAMLHSRTPGTLVSVTFQA